MKSHRFVALTAIHAASVTQLGAESDSSCRPMVAHHRAPCAVARVEFWPDGAERGTDCAGGVVSITAEVRRVERAGCRLGRVGRGGGCWWGGRGGRPSLAHGVADVLLAVVFPTQQPQVVEGGGSALGPVH